MSSEQGSAHKKRCDPENKAQGHEAYPACGHAKSGEGFDDESDDQECGGHGDKITKLDKIGKMDKIS